MARPKAAMPAGTLDLLAGVPDATGPAVAAAIEAAGLTLDQAAQLMGLADGRAAASRAKTAGTDRTRLALLLLATGQHPTLAVAPR